MLRFLQWLVARRWLMRIVGGLSGSLNPWNPEVRRNPYPAYAKLRTQPALMRMRLFGGFVASRYSDVEAMLRSPAFSTNREAVPLMASFRRASRDAPEFLGFLDHNLLMIDGSRHRRLRGLVSKAFTPKRVETLRSRVVTIVGDLLDRAGHGGSMDVMRDLAQPLPAIVIAELLGIPTSDQAKFCEWSDDLVQILDPLSGHEGIEPPKRAMRSLSTYFGPLLAERRSAPRDDLLSAMISAEEGGETLAQDELVALAALLLAAGHETTTNLIGNAVSLFLRYPAERKRLQDDPGLLESAVEECLRFEPPVQLTDRAVVEPTVLAGTSLKPGDIVVALLASANRDPEHFADADRFDVGRQNNDHLSFGLGGHYCLGAALARLEGQVALGALVQRFPDFRGPTDLPDYKPSIVLRGPKSLRIELR